jgi:hypothetical protein
MSPIDEPASFEPPKGSASEGRKPKTAGNAPEAGSELVSVTFDVGAGRIVTIEGVDASGSRRELSEEEKARLARSPARPTLEHLVEQAFEAGIDCVLGDEAGETEQSESQEDAELSRMLLRSLMERSAVKRLVQRDVLSRAIVGTLIEQAAGGAAPH